MKSTVLPRSPRIFLAIAFIAFGNFLTANARAVLVDWDTLTWTPGSLSNSYNVDPSSPGNDVTVTFSGDTNRIRKDPYTGVYTPYINQTLQGGLNPAQSSLYLGVNFIIPSNSITVTVNFSALYTQGVQNVSFSLFGIDQRGGFYQDQISSITALSADGKTLIAPTITGLGSAVSLTGAGLNQTLTGTAFVPTSGAGSGAGDATISFGGAAIQSFTFVFSNGLGAKYNPAYQDISLFDISFTAVPELNPTWLAVAVCFGAVYFGHRRKTLLAFPAK